MLSLSFAASLLPSVSFSVFIGNFLQEARTLPDHCFSFEFWQPRDAFFFSGKIFFLLLEEEKCISQLLKFYRISLLQKEKELVWRGFEPLAVEVVNKQLKESDGERETVDARERALHREATVALDECWANFKQKQFGIYC